ncbi:hypothetical protein A0O28_0047560 [Trichoderma guizhouense]|uniref:Uncharacterized protein n=1 Tax=Trichoderma guizhouense TaxID=1491466 RepID=A0A1T3CDH2_9HYPO|nr:hypothetical protein A0O28_0047560 [Trichoderma guizhouense]
MTANNTPFVSEDWHDEESDNLNTFRRGSLGVVSTSSSVCGNDDSGDEDSSDYASDDSRHDDDYASDHSGADELDINGLGIASSGNSGPSSNYSSRPSSRDSNSVAGALSVDMVAELGILLVLPPRFVRPGMVTRPYDATQAPEEGLRLSMAFAPNGKITGELADAAFAIEIHDAKKYQGSIGDGRRWETVKHMLEEMRASFYPKRESDE